MTYEIGQKVETPLGVGLIVASSLDSFGINDLYKVKLISPNMSYQVRIFGKDLKPYKTAHEKLIEMGFAYILDYYDYRLFYNEKTHEELYIYDNKTYDANINITLELSRILTQYLEEMVE